VSVVGIWVVEGQLEVGELPQRLMGIEGGLLGGRVAMLVDMAVMAADMLAIASSRWLVAWKTRLKESRSQGVWNVEPYDGQGKLRVGWGCVVMSCGGMSCGGIVIVALSLLMVAICSSIIVSGCVVTIVVGVVGEVLAGSWVAIGRPVVRLNVLKLEGANVHWMLAFKASKSKRSGSGAISLRFKVGVGSATAMLVVVDMGR